MVEVEVVWRLLLVWWLDVTQCHWLTAGWCVLCVWWCSVTERREGRGRVAVGFSSLEAEMAVERLVCCVGVFCVAVWAW